MEAPIVAPVTASSETGVSITRDLPNFLSKSFIVSPTYHGDHSPWPITKNSS